MPALPFAGLGLALTLGLAGCSDSATAPAEADVQFAQAALSASCTVTPSGQNFEVTLTWSRVPTQEILILRETIPGPDPVTVTLPRQKRKGSMTETIGFFPTVAFFIARNGTDFVRAGCSGN